jgi:hypothetical protein
MAELGTRFVVKRLKWAEHYGGKRTRQPGEVAVKSFASFEEAEAERAKREEEYRKAVNPFDCGTAVHYWSHLDEPRLRDWLMDHGIDPPKPNKDGTTNWSDWWKKNQKKLGPERRAAVWEALDKVRFFAVREEPARPVGYAVVMVNWEYNDEYYDADPEGGALVQVYRSRERAEAECARQNGEARGDWSFVDEMMGEVEDEELDDDEEFVEAAFDMRERLCRRRGLVGDQKLAKGEGVFRSTAGVPFFEVIEVELEGLE